MITKSPLKYTKRDDQAMERSLLLFENSVKSKITFREYLKRLEKFRQFCNADNFDSLSRLEPGQLATLVFALQKDFQSGIDLQFLMTTTNGTVFVEAIEMGDQIGS
jgi:hypothetical protein